MRRLLGLTAPLALVVLVFVSLTRFMRFEARWVSLLAAFSPYAMIGYVALLLAFLVAARRTGRRPLLLLGAVASMVAIAAQVIWFSPLYSGDGDIRTGRPDLTVLTANLDGGQADALTPVNAVRDHAVDVVVLVEVRPSTLDRLLARGLGQLLPYHRGAPSETDQGTMVFSRFPLGQATSLSLSKGGLDLRVLAPHPFRLLVVHTSQPVKHAATWVKDLAVVRDSAASSVSGGDTVVAGDFNATRDQSQFRAVLGQGLRDAAEQSGAGWQPTWPTRDWKAWLRPLITIDHVLTSGAYVARRTYTVEPKDTDHLALIAELDRRHG